MQPNLEALRQVVRVLETVPEEKFNIHLILSEFSCGTVGCAIGWASQDPWFQALGLRLTGGKVATETLIEIFRIPKGDIWHLFWWVGYRDHEDQLPKITGQEVIMQLNQYITAHGPKIITNT